MVNLKLLQMEGFGQLKKSKSLRYTISFALI